MNTSTIDVDGLPPEEVNIKYTNIVLMLLQEIDLGGAPNDLKPV